jgi:hypothetical protein
VSESNDAEENTVAQTGTTKAQKTPAKQLQADGPKPEELEGPALVAWVNQAWQHLHAGDEMPTDIDLPALAAQLRQEMADAPDEDEEEPAAPAVPELPEELAKDLPPAVLAFMAHQAAQTNRILEGMFEVVSKQAAKTGSEVTLEGSVEELVQQLSGTVSAGPPPENPLPYPVVFVSKGAMFKAIRKPRFRTTTHDGQQFFTTGIAYDFAPNGRFETVDPLAAEWLRGRPGMNNLYWEELKPPFTAPDPGALFERIIDLALALDDGPLAELEEEEKASHKRPAVLAAIKHARTKIQGFEAVA